LEHDADPQKKPAHQYGRQRPDCFAVASCDQPLETRKEMLDVLLKHGVDINTVAGNQRTVMDIAVER